MGTILASAIIDKAEFVLHDPSNIQWARAELLGWLNDGQREVCTILPEQSVTLGNITTIVGSKQTLPTGGLSLLKVIRNMGISGTAPGVPVRRVSQEALEQHSTDWHSRTAVESITNYTYDPRAPRVFYVYPPSVVNNRLEALYTVSPADIAEGAAIVPDDVFEPALLNYILYRAFSKDTATGGFPGRAADHHSKFAALVTAKKLIDASQQPPVVAKS